GEISDGLTRRVLGTEPGLNGLWHFDENSGLTAFDSTRNLPAALTNLTWIASGVVFDDYTVFEEADFTDFLAGVDAESDPLNYRITAPPAKGVLTLLDTNTGAFRYTANPSANGVDTFSYVVN